VFRDAYPVWWTRQQAVVTLPEHIDVSNAGQIREELLSVLNRGAHPRSQNRIGCLCPVFKRAVRDRPPTVMVNPR
jgi:hypothetical protein